MAAFEQSSIAVGLRSDTVEHDISPDPQHAPCDPDHEVQNAFSEELLRLVLKESEAARLQAEDGGPGRVEEEEGGDVNNHVSSDNYNGWEDEVGGGAAEADDPGEGRGSDEERGAGGGRYTFPVRPGAEDCAFYIKTGTCKFGSLCKFNHPVRRRTHAARERVKEKDELIDRPGLIECKETVGTFNLHYFTGFGDPAIDATVYYLRTGGCRYGKSCKYNHPRTKPSISPVMELNFLGLPIRPGEKECPYYMRNGSCKYAANCRFNHPDPTASGGGGGGGGSGDPFAGYGNGPSASLKGPSQAAASWSTSPRTLNETATFIPAVYPSPIGGVAPHKAEWNTYQVPVYPPERNMLPPQAFMGRNPGNESNAYSNNNKKQMVVDEFPERPGQPECTFFMKTGDCKFKSNCKYHHPKNRNPTSTPVPLSDKGLPLRPDQNICSYYSRYGICKFGPACRFNHPVNWTPSNLSAPFGMVGTSNVGDVAIQQSL